MNIDREVEAWHASQPPNIPPPIITEQPVNDQLQTGESRKLGGELRIQSPWRHD